MNRSSFVSKKLIALVGLLLVASLGLSACTLNGSKPTATVEQQTQQIQATVTVVDQSGAEKSYPVTTQSNVSAYDVLKALDSAHDDFSMGFSSFILEGKNSYYVTTINGFTPDSKKQFWNFQVNGVDSAVGVSDYIVKQSDALKFFPKDLQ